ncbi:MAG: flagellar type III secretion system protein FliQ [Polyangiaceae bacterium]|nr:flagellar type III secretion system protein FliQ [Polyangiaceae bacterium]
MTTDGAIELLVKALMTAALVAGPMVLAGLLVGLVVGVLQAATQVNEASIAFVAKLLAVVVTLAALGPWTLRRMVDYTSRTLSETADVVR